MNKLCIDELELKGKRVLIRVDFNVPLTEKGEVEDDIRIRAALPTIQYAIERCARVILLSHLGRPKGKVVPAMSLKPVARRLSELLGKKVVMADDCIGEGVKALVSQMGDGDVLLLENCRFHEGDEKNDEAFSRALAELCDIYVNDAFGAAHRAHASTVGITRFAPVSACGFLMNRELEYLGKALSSPDRPFIALLGGAKVSDKLEVIRNLIDKVDFLLIGGGMAYTFLKAQGFSVGRSLVEEDKLDIAREIMERARLKGVVFLLPLDSTVAERPEAGVHTRVCRSTEIPPDMMALDIGPATIEAFSKAIKASKTVFWNGPLGVYEKEPFRKGTVALASAMAESGATSIIGGGNTEAAVAQEGLAKRMPHTSTGGGASLEFLGGRELPGVAALTDRKP